MNDDKGYQILNDIASDYNSGALALCGDILHYFLYNEALNSFPKIKNNIEYAMDKIGAEHSEMPSIIRLLSKLHSIYLAHLEDSDTSGFQAEVKMILEELEKIPESVSNYAAETIKDFEKIITLSNSKTVASTFGKLHQNGKSFVALICESSPGRESYIMAKTLQDDGIDVIIIPDTAIADVIDRTSCVIIGCDTISPTHFRNKIGSYQLALIARHFGAPYYILGDSYKVVKDIRSIGEVKETVKINENNLKTLFKLFEDVPINLADEIILEKGIFKASDIKAWIKDLIKDF